MKFPLLLAAICIFGGPFFLSAVGQQAPNPLALPPPKPDPHESLRAPSAKTHWNVSVDIQMVALPEDLALLLLPDLQSGETRKIESAVGQLQVLLRKKEATLLAWPWAIGVDGSRLATETSVEKWCPTEFEPPLEPQTFSIIGNERHTPLSVVPKSFETRNLGAAFETVPTVASDGQRVAFSIQASRTIFLGFDRLESGKIGDGFKVRLDQPIFAVSKSAATLNLRNGQHALLGVHKLASPEDQFELTIIRAIATKAD